MKASQWRTQEIPKKYHTLRQPTWSRYMCSLTHRPPFWMTLSSMRSDSRTTKWGNWETRSRRRNNTLKRPRSSIQIHLLRITRKSSSSPGIRSITRPAPRMKIVRAVVRICTRNSVFLETSLIQEMRTKKTRRRRRRTKKMMTSALYGSTSAIRRTAVCHQWECSLKLQWLSTERLPYLEWKLRHRASWWAPRTRWVCAMAQDTRLFFQIFLCRHNPTPCLPLSADFSILFNLLYNNNVLPLNYRWTRRRSALIALPPNSCCHRVSYFASPDWMFHLLRRLFPHPHHPSLQSSILSDLHYEPY